MSKLIVFNHVSLDGYFTDAGGDMSWAHETQSRPDPEWTAFVDGNARGDARLLFGRVTYAMMASFWPTPQAAAAMPVVAERMNASQKVVFSTTLKKATWKNTTLVGGDPAGAVRAMKKDGGTDLVLMGSGSIVAQLAGEGLVDEFRLVVNPLVLGAGRSLFTGVAARLKRTGSRAFANGNVLLTYEPAR